MIEATRRQYSLPDGKNIMPEQSIFSAKNGPENFSVLHKSQPIREGLTSPIRPS